MWALLRGSGGTPPAARMLTFVCTCRHTDTCCALCMLRFRARVARAPAPGGGGGGGPSPSPSPPAPPASCPTKSDTFQRGEISPSVCNQPSDCNYRCSAGYALTQKWDFVSSMCRWTATPTQRPSGCGCDVLQGTPSNLAASDGNAVDTAWEGTAWASSLEISVNLEGVNCNSVYDGSGGGGACTFLERAALSCGVQFVPGRLVVCDGALCASASVARRVAHRLTPPHPTPAPPIPCVCRCHRFHTADSGSSGSSNTLVYVGAAVGAMVVLAVVVGCFVAANKGCVWPHTHTHTSHHITHHQQQWAVEKAPPFLGLSLARRCTTL